jgi:hypothetical protein
LPRTTPSDHAFNSYTPFGDDSQEVVMSRRQSLQLSVERALALAHAAVDEPTRDRIALARASADDAIERVHNDADQLTRHEVRRVVPLVTQLRALLVLVDRSASLARPSQAN